MKLKPYIILVLLTLVLSGTFFCHTKTLKIIYQSSHKDHPTELNEAQVYILKKYAVNADFDIDKLKNLDNHINDSTSLRQIFEPVNGNYNYYQFVSTFKGRALVFPGDDLKDSVKTFHDILIVKTNGENKIVDAFQYTLEWGERPFQYDLFKCSMSDVLLTDDMNIGMLKFVRTEYWDAHDKYLREKGTIKLKKYGW